MPEIRIRPIEPRDNAALARIIRSTLEEFGAVRPGTVYYEETTDHLYELFRDPMSAYWVVEIDGEVVGGAGIYPTEGIPEDTSELVKMYLIPKARGLGLGKTLIEKCVAEAKEKGYKKLYLESMPELKRAISLYEKAGFHYLDKQFDTAHTGCAVWMLKELADPATAAG
ncbi:MAG TPA: GNAT family N-acetyltransferase [Chitinophagaceae bacterium]|nr:GNAT family N-acetyltransferase [Chitinophagaceae bacterium]